MAAGESLTPLHFKVVLSKNTSLYPRIRIRIRAELIQELYAEVIQELCCHWDQKDFISKACMDLYEEGMHDGSIRGGHAWIYTSRACIQEDLVRRGGHACK